MNSSPAKLRIYLRVLCMHDNFQINYTMRTVQMYLLLGTSVTRERYCTTVAYFGDLCALRLILYIITIIISDVRA